ncbi:hypothetical protein SISSUDRAFT_1039184 [Sistotremastrum suecicum HHB10207 ss-3]|uniref:Uncharacterized protein n=1 Tax=Sistotremastrum suecicum HHB10207 ss-3 TaxID=1314776 RepID=A0A166JDV8_9AGAM|nr:hypothetical protein SISSUDRAFT_1039184 [Sistotremastrum suecicum HHB10207 ss-3]
MVSLQSHTHFAETNGSIVMTSPPLSDKVSLTLDPVTSLREAALRTLKTRRRKPPNPTGGVDSTDAAPTGNISADDSMEILSYGPDDRSKDNSPQPAEKEEGEISDEEPDSKVSDVPRQSSPNTDTRKIPNTSSDVEMQLDPPSSQTIPPQVNVVPSSAGPPATSTRSPKRPRSPPPTPIVQEASHSSNEVAPPPHPSKPVSGLQSSGPSQEPVPIDVGHVRPNLSMSATQLWEAKEIILDLLGWGVPPTYLVDCGLTREAVYYTFTELNLKLPETLDTRGLAPYMPTVVAAETKRPQPQHSNPDDRRIGSQLPTQPPPVASVQASANRGTADIRTPIVHPLPPKPNLNFQTHTSASVSPSQESAYPTLLSEDVGLRLSKDNDTPRDESQTLSPSATPNPNPTLLEIETLRRNELLARKAVVASRKAKRQPTTPLANYEQDYKMDVDSEGTSTDVKQVDDFLNTIGGEAMSSFMDSAVDASLSQKPAMMEPERYLNDSPTTEQGLAQVQAQAPSQSGLSRRSSKRPVAADFVDFPLTPSEPKEERFANKEIPSMTSNPSTFANGSSRKPPSFANIAPIRRCIIDLSDSEDEAGPSRPLSALSMNEFQAKEAKIRELREQIAAREKNRLRKTSSVASGTPPVSPLLSSASAQKSSVSINGDSSLYPNANLPETVQKPPGDHSNDPNGEAEVVEDAPLTGLDSESLTPTADDGQPQAATEKNSLLTAEAEMEELIPEDTKKAYRGVGAGNGISAEVRSLCHSHPRRTFSSIGSR